MEKDLPKEQFLTLHNQYNKQIRKGGDVNGRIYNEHNCKFYCIGSLLLFICQDEIKGP